MATECTRDAIQQFLNERGGRVKHEDLIQHFRLIFPEDPLERTAVRETFKGHVDSIACVKVEDGVRLVCLKKRYRRLGDCAAAAGGQVGLCVAVAGTGTGRQGAESSSPIPGEGMIPPADLHPLTRDDADRPEAVCRNEAALPLRASRQLSASPPLRAPSAASCSTAQPRETLPGSGYGNDSEVKAPPVPCVHISSEEIPEEKPPVSQGSATAEVSSAAHSLEMGHRWSSHRAKTLSIERCTTVPASDVPRITVIGASPLPAVADGSVFILPGSGPGRSSPGTPNDEQHTHKQSSPGDDAKSQAETGSVAPADGSQGHRTKRGLRLDDDDVCGHDGGEEGRLDSDGEDCATPRAGRQNFIELMMDRSPTVRRSMALRNSSFLSARRSDGDSASLASSNADEDGPAVTLDPLEHEWMMCASDGEWDRLLALLTSEPTLVLRKDFVTGFTCLHWAAKQGNPELLALVVNFAKLHGVAVDVNARSSAGYTPLHLAAMHSHMEVVKLLVGAYDADVEVRDYGGKKAGQYLANGAGVDIQDIIGAYGGGETDADAVDGREGPRWSFLPQLRPLRMLGPGEGEAGARLRVKPVRRMSTMSRVKPKLQRLRDRTSQMVHSASFREMGVGPSRPRSEFISGPEPAH